MLYIDTSVLVCALTKEQRTSSVQQWLALQAADQLQISDWVVSEFSSALALKLRTGQIGMTQRGGALAMFTQLTVNTFQVLPVERSAFRLAARFCDLPTLGLRAADALHLAICAEHGTTLCTLDQQLGQAAPLVGVASVLI
jgi:uncharacterized protein